MHKARRVLSMVRGIAAIVALFFVVGCAGIEPPTPVEVISHPLGTEPLRIGMTKEHVVSIWGKPDAINKIGVSKGVGGTSREEWVYYSRYSGIPIDGGYLSKAKHLYFDGNHLVRFSK
jgi:hypothetical protein